MGYEPNWRTEAQIASASTGQVKTVTPPSGTRVMKISVEGANARISLAGVTPATTQGHVYLAGVSPVTELGGHVFKFASVSSSTSTVNVTYGE